MGASTDDQTFDCPVCHQTIYLTFVRENGYCPGCQRKIDRIDLQILLGGTQADALLGNWSRDGVREDVLELKRIFMLGNPASESKAGP